MIPGLLPLLGTLLFQMPEVNSRDSTPTFTTRSNLVLLRVVVRDKSGKAIGTLTKEDFQLLDRGKPQVISKFSIEKSGAIKSAFSPKETAAPAGPIEPDRFTAYLFDDVHLSFGDLVIARDAALRHLTASRSANSRAAIYTISGQTMLDFTDDEARIRDALMRIRPQSRLTPMGVDCPDVDHYMADLIRNKNDSQALATAAAEAMVCGRLTKEMTALAAQIAQAAATRVVSVGDMESRLALSTLKDVIRRTAAMPGQRAVILVSPGFLIREQRADQLEAMDRAIRLNVTISSLDARGLYIPGGIGDASGSGPVSVAKSRYLMDAASTQADVLAELADGTGGTFFHNSNDLEAGFRRVASPPEFYYVLGFTPQSLKFDGTYHALKVTTKGLIGLNLLARRGYFAPKHEVDAAQTAKREIEEALFSRDELRDVPVDLHTQFFKSNEVDAKLAVLAHIDLKHLTYRKAEGRNCNTLTVVAGLFDRNGNYVTSIMKTVDMKLKDETLEVRLAKSGITIKSSFDVTSGAYFVRLVVRDTEGQKLAALNGAVEIP